MNGVPAPFGAVFVLIGAAMCVAWLIGRLRRKPAPAPPYYFVNSPNRIPAAPPPMPPLDHRRLVSRPWDTETDRQFLEIVANFNDTTDH